MSSAQVPSLDLSSIAAVVLRRWKLVAAITLFTLVATYGVLRLVPKYYKSTVEILVYDPQRQLDAAVQKPISPFVDALSYEAMSTEINVLKSKSVALRVANELGLDTDPDFQPRDLRIADLTKWLGIADWLERLGFRGAGQVDGNAEQAMSGPEAKAEKLDEAADALIGRLDIWQESYIIFVSATSRDPIKAQRLAATVANDYLAIQREARQEALERAAGWLKFRIDNLRSHVLETETSIEELKGGGGVHDIESEKVREQEIRDLSAELMTARQEVRDKSAHLEQARHLFDTHSNIDSIPELAESARLAELRQLKMALNFSLADLQNRLGEHNPQVLSARGQLAIVDKQMNAEAEKMLVTMKNAHDLAVQREQSLEANLQNLTANLNSESYIKMQQLRHSADADRKDYESYLAQYNDIAEQRETQYTGARIISAATLPRSPTSSRVKFYALGGMAGLGGGLLLAFLLGYLKPGVKTGAEIEQSFGLPVVGFVPLVSQRKTRGAANYRPLVTMVNEPFSHLSEAVQAMRVSVELSNAGPKVILITSALPGEGKSTTAMLLAASSASSGKKTILLDCDLRVRSISEALGSRHPPGLSEFLGGKAKLADVITEDPVTKISLISAGSTAPNAADLLMSRRMLDLVSELRLRFDYVVIDGPPLLPVVDALALATIADKILMIVEWSRTPRASLHEALRLLGPEADRLAGVVLNKVDFREMPAYGGRYSYRAIGGYYNKG